MNNYTINNAVIGSSPLSAGTVIVPKIISAEVSYYSTAVMQVFSCVISLLGIVANAFNIAVFIRQGVKSDSASASLLGLAVADVTYLITVLLLGVFQAVILYAPPDLPWSPMDIAYLFAGIPNYLGAQVAKLATAYVSLQRCICVVLPFKVKSLFTAKRTLAAFVLMYALTGLGYIPLFISVFRLRSKFDPFANMTRLGVIGSPGNKLKVATAMYVNNAVFTLGSVATVLVCTMVTVYQLHLSKKWRESASADTSTKTTTSNNNNDNSGGNSNSNNTDAKQSKMQKERKLVKVIVSISIIFLITYTPNLGYLILTYINPHARILGKNHNLAQLIVGTTSIIEAMNSSINIIVYYLLSSSYKQELRLMLGLEDAKNKL